MRLILLFISSLISTATSPFQAQSVPVNPDIERAMLAVEAAIPKALADPGRPQFHFLAPAQWINDPNGPLYFQGEYHLFYQHNPYDDRWDHMHWGHAKSTDLAHWEHLPIALWPSHDKGEGHCFSGCATLTEDGSPVLIYTSIPTNGNATEISSQWMATSRDRMLTWEKHPKNPILEQAIHGDQRIWDWRDPFVFKEDGQTFLVLGGNLDKREIGKAVVTLYRTTTPDLTHWEYLGILFQHPEERVKNIECPNFIKLGEKWVLIYSPHDKVEYVVGSFDLEGFKFTPEKYGVMDQGTDFYAPNCLFDDTGRCVSWGWVRGFEPGKGWNGCHTVPRVLSLDEDGNLLQQPAPELQKLRGPSESHNRWVLSDSEEIVAEKTEGCFEIEATFDLGMARSIGIRVLNEPGGEARKLVEWDGKSLQSGQVKADIKNGDSNSLLDLRVFVDRSVMEIYADQGRTCFTTLLDPPVLGGGVEVYVEGGPASVNEVEHWPIEPIWITEKPPKDL